MESVHVSLGAQQLRQEHRAARSAPQGVVGEAHELVVVLGVRPQAAHGHGHAVLQVPVQPGLGAVRLLKVVQELLGGRGQGQLLSTALEARPGGFDFVQRGLVPEPGENGGDTGR